MRVRIWHGFGTSIGPGWNRRVRIRTVRDLRVCGPEFENQHHARIIRWVRIQAVQEQARKLVAREALGDEDMIVGSHDTS